MRPILCWKQNLEYSSHAPANFSRTGRFAYPNGRENVQNSKYGAFKRDSPCCSPVGSVAAAVGKHAHVGATEQPESSARCSVCECPETVVPVLVFHADKDGEAAEFRKVRIEINTANRSCDQQSISHGAVGGSCEGRRATERSAIHAADAQ